MVPPGAGRLVAGALDAAQGLAALAADLAVVDHGVLLGRAGIGGQVATGVGRARAGAGAGALVLVIGAGRRIQVVLLHGRVPLSGG